MSEKINVLFGANIGPLVDNLKVAANELTKFGETAKKTPQRAKTAIDELNTAYRSTIKDAKNIALAQGATSAAFEDAKNKAAQLKSKLDELNISLHTTGEATSGGGGLQRASQGFNTLGHSFNQLTRELPAFTNSMQTGFMALSNNIPMFVDQIQSIKRANAELIAQGQPVQSTFKQIAGAVFSWQTGLSVGVTLLTMFGAKLFTASEGADKLKKSIEEASTAQKKFNDLKDYYLLTERERELKEENLKFDEIKNLYNERIKAFETMQYQLSLKRQAMSFKELIEFVTLKEELVKIEQSHANKVKEINRTTTQEQIKQNDLVYKGLVNNVEMVKKSFQFKMPTFIKEMPAKFVRFGDTVSNQVNRVGVFFDELGQKIGGWEQMVSAALANASASFGAALMDGGLEDAGKAMIKMLGSMAVQIGAAMIAMGLPMILGGLTAPKGVLMVAGGTALGIAGGAMMASGKAPGSSGASAGSYNGGGQMMPSFVGGGQSFFTLDGTVRGQDLVISSNITRRDNRR